MRGALLLLGLVATPAVAGKKATFGDEPLKAGLVIDMTSATDMSMAMEVVADGETHSVSNRQVQEKAQSVEVLRVDDSGTVVEYRVSWSRHHQEDTGAGPDQVVDLPVVGPTFVVAGSDVSRADGEPLTEAQADFFEGFEDPFADFAKFGNEVRGRKVKIGQVITSDQFLPGGEVPAGPDAKAELDGSMTLREVRSTPDGDEGVFDVVLVATMSQSREDGVMRMDLNLGGQLLVDVATGWLKRFEVAGPMTMEARNDAGLSMSGKGSVETTQSNTFRR